LSGRKDVFYFANAKKRSPSALASLVSRMESYLRIS